jgi:hypothetical protein
MNLSIERKIREKKIGKKNKLKGRKWAMMGSMLKLIWKRMKKITIKNKSKFPF